MVDEDVSVAKAVAIARYEEAFRLAQQGMDTRGMILAQQHIDRITGVRTEQTGDAMADFADLMGLASTDPEKAQKIVDAEIVVKGEDAVEVRPVDWKKAESEERDG